MDGEQSAYYDGDCEIYTLDILPLADKFEGYNNIHTYVVDVSNEDSVWGFIESLNGLKFDIIIDDASHRYKDQYISLVYFRQCLKKGGLFIMEDLHTSYANIPDIAFEDRPLGFLTNLKNNWYFYDERVYKELVDSIDDIIIYNHRNNDQTMKELFNSRSVTALITFLDE